MFERSQMREGMIVRSSDGEKLGKVYVLKDDAFHIEKGLFFPKDYAVRYTDVREILGEEIILKYGRESLLKLSGVEASVSEERSVVSEGRSERDFAATTVRGTADVAIPLHREELDISKRDVQTGEVRIHKDVVEEVQTVNIPVRRERVRVEHRNVDPNQPSASASFQEETIVVPLHAEEVDVQKRVVVDEEVVIHKDVIQEERRVAESVRHEEVDIRNPDDESPRSPRLEPEEPGPRRS